MSRADGRGVAGASTGAGAGSPRPAEHSQRRDDKPRLPAKPSSLSSHVGKTNGATTPATTATTAAASASATAAALRGATLAFSHNRERAAAATATTTAGRAVSRSPAPSPGLRRQQSRSASPRKRQPPQAQTQPHPPPQRQPQAQPSPHLRPTPSPARSDQTSRNDSPQRSASLLAATLAASRSVSPGRPATGPNVPQSTGNGSGRWDRSSSSSSRAASTMTPPPAALPRPPSPRPLSAALRASVTAAAAARRGQAAEGDREESEERTAWRAATRATTALQQQQQQQQQQEQQEQRELQQEQEKHRQQQLRHQLSYLEAPRDREPVDTAIIAPQRQSQRPRSRSTVTARSLSVRSEGPRAVAMADAGTDAVVDSVRTESQDKKGQPSPSPPPPQLRKPSPPPPPPRKITQTDKQAVPTERPQTTSTATPPVQRQQQQRQAIKALNKDSAPALPVPAPAPAEAEEAGGVVARPARQQSVGPGEQPRRGTQQHRVSPPRPFLPPRSATLSASAPESAAAAPNAATAVNSLASAIMAGSLAAARHPRAPSPPPTRQLTRPRTGSRSSHGSQGGSRTRSPGKQHQHPHLAAGGTGGMPQTLRPDRKRSGSTGRLHHRHGHGHGHDGNGNGSGDDDYDSGGDDGHRHHGAPRYVHKDGRLVKHHHGPGAAPRRVAQLVQPAAVLVGGRRHKHKHHEGTRRRWRETLTERQRRRYEAVWASNRGSKGIQWPGRGTAAATDEVGAEDADTVPNVVVRDLWRRSRLPADELAEVWDVVAAGPGGGANTGTGPAARRLTKTQFVVGLWLIDQRLRGRKIPPRVSDSVWASARGTQVEVRRR